VADVTCHHTPYITANRQRNQITDSVFSTRQTITILLLIKEADTAAAAAAATADWLISKLLVAC